MSEPWPVCAVCRQAKPDLQEQYGGIGRWWACLACIREAREKRQPGPDAVLKQGQQKAPERGLFEEET